MCCLELGGVLGIPRSPFGHIADSTDLLAGSWGGGPAGHAEAAVSLDSFEAACCAGVLSLLAAPGIQRLRCWKLIRVSWSRRVATLQYTSLEEATSTPMDVDQSPRGAGVWRCPALHIPRSFEHQSPDPDQSNTYIEKEIIKIQKKASPETI